MTCVSAVFNGVSRVFQVVVVQAISALCQKYPRKHIVMMNFLSNMLRDDVSHADASESSSRFKTSAPLMR